MKSLKLIYENDHAIIVLMSPDVAVTVRCGTDRQSQDEINRLRYELDAIAAEASWKFAEFVRSRQFRSP